MRGVVIGPRDLQCHPAMQIHHAENCLLFRVVAATDFWIGKCCTAQHVHGAHEGADIPLDISSIMGLLDRSRHTPDAVTLALDLDSVRLKLLGVVPTDLAHLSKHWILHVDFETVDPSLLWKACLLK